MANKKTYTLAPPHQYTGNQAIIMSDRVLLNAKSDAVLIFAKQAIGLSSAGTLNFDSDKSCIINSPQIYLGLQADGKPANEPLMLGSQTSQWLTDFIDNLIPLIKVLEKKGVFVGTKEYADIPQNFSAQVLTEELARLKGKIVTLTSKQNYTV